MTQPPGPYDAYGNPQDHVPGRDDATFGAADSVYEQPRRGGFSAFPFPGYTTTTRNGTQVSFGGCCLPLPIGCLATTLAFTGLAVTRVLRAPA